MIDWNFEGLRFVCTCEACPEKYDVYHGHKIVGYVRLRWGRVRVHYPNFMSDNVVYSHGWDDGMMGMFEDDDEREYHLSRIAKVLKECIKEDKDD